jgi:hypothetical protein
VCVNKSNDPLNCGACGHDCLGGSCNGGLCQPTTLVPGAPGHNVPALATNGAIFWTYNDGLGLWGVRSCSDGGCGGTPATVSSFSNGFPVADALVVNGGTLYWAALNTEVHPSTHHLHSCATSGCGGSPVSAGSMHMTGAFAADSSNFYWGGTNASAQAAIMFCTPALNNCGTGGGTPVQFTLANASHAFWYGLLYWTDTSAAQVVKCTGSTSSGCTSTSVVANTATSPSVLTVDGTNVYFADSAGVHQCAVGGCASSLTLAGGQQNANSIVSDAKYVYWASSTSIMRGTIDVMNSGTVIAQNQTNAATIGLGTKAVYWSVQDGAIMMLAK